jgi:hypothetical protein
MTRQLKQNELVQKLNDRLSTNKPPRPSERKRAPRIGDGTAPKKVACLESVRESGRTNNEERR